MPFKISVLRDMIVAREQICMFGAWVRLKHWYGRIMLHVVPLQRKNWEKSHVITNYLNHWGLILCQCDWFKKKCGPIIVRYYTAEVRIRFNDLKNRPIQTESGSSSRLIDQFGYPLFYAGSIYQFFFTIEVLMCCVNTRKIGADISCNGQGSG